MAKAGYVSIGGVWRKVVGEYVSIGGVWRKVSRQYVSIGGVWRDAGSTGGGDYVTYGVDIDETNPDPAAALTYTDDAVGMSPMFGPGDSPWDDMPIFKDIKPCSVTQGGTAIIKYINKNNFEEYEDGTTVSADPNAGLNIMIEFPKIGWKFSRSGNILSVKITNDPNKGSEGFSYHAFSRNFEGDCKNLYLGAYVGFFYASCLRSVANGLPEVRNSASEFRTLARNNGQWWDAQHFFSRVLLQCLFLIRFKSRNSQAVLGKGYTSGGFQSIAQSGRMVTSGMYGILSSSDTFQPNRVKCFGIEDLWGNVSTFVDGLYKATNVSPVFVQYKDFADAAVGQSFTISNTVPGSFITKVAGTNLAGFFPTVGGSGNYYSDLGHTTFSYFASGGMYNDGQNAGIFYLVSSGNASSPTTGARLMYLAPDPDFVAPLTATDVHLSGTEGDSISYDLSDHVSGGTPPYNFTTS